MQEDILAVREVVIKNLSYENRSLRDRISTLEMRVIQIERTINKNSQNSRKNNMEIVGIPKEILHAKLEETVINLFNHLPEPVACTLEDIETVH